MGQLMRRAFTCGAVVLFLACSFAQGATQSNAPLQGTVKSADGKPLEGVPVSARAEGQTVTTSVYTDRDGRYAFPPLAAPQQDGQYKIWSQAVGFQRSTAEAVLANGKTAEQNFVLQPFQDFYKQMSGVDWMSSLPENTPEDRRMKRIVGSNCINCHQSSFPLQNRFDSTGWNALVTFMSRAGDSAQASSSDATRGDYNGFIYGYKEEIVNYLARVRGPNSQLDYKPRPRPTGDATEVVITEYDVSPGHLPGYTVIENGTDWALGEPSRIESGATHDLAWDPHGYVWFPDNVTPERTVGRLDPKTGKITNYRDVSNQGTTVNSHDIFVDHLGNIWVNDGVDEAIDELDTHTDKFRRFPRPASVTGGIGRLFDEDSKGNIWAGIQGTPIKKVDPATNMKYVTADPQNPGGAIMLDPQTGEFTFYKGLTPALTTYGVSVDADDNVWFTRTGRDIVGMVDTHTGKVSEISLGQVNDIPHTSLDDQLVSKYEPVDEQGTPFEKAPRRQAADRKNGTQWIALSKESALAKIDIHTRKVTEYQLPYRYSFPYALAVDKNHMVWVAALNTDSVFKFDPTTEKFTEYRFPTLGTDTRCITVDNGTNPPTVWVAYWQTSKLTRLQFRAPSAGRTVAQATK